MENTNLTTIQFAQALFGLEPDTPIAHEFDMEFGQTDERWWSCQREHFAFWAISQNTNGVKGYRHKPNTNARTMYNRLCAPELLLWLIEALHISLQQESNETGFNKFMKEFSVLLGWYITTEVIIFDNGIIGNEKVFLPKVKLQIEEDIVDLTLHEKEELLTKFAQGVFGIKKNKDNTFHIERR